MTSNVFAGWKTATVLTMILIQIVYGSLCAIPLSDRTFVPSSVAVTAQERGSTAENKALLAFDADDHVRCEQRCQRVELDKVASSEGLPSSATAAFPRENRIYLISRPPKQLV